MWDKIKRRVKYQLNTSYLVLLEHEDGIKMHYDAYFLWTAKIAKFIVGIYYSDYPYILKFKRH